VEFVLPGAADKGNAIPRIVEKPEEDIEKARPSEDAGSETRKPNHAILAAKDDAPRKFGPVFEKRLLDARSPHGRLDLDTGEFHLLDRKLENDNQEAAWASLRGIDLAAYDYFGRWLLLPSDLTLIPSTAEAWKKASPRELANALLKSKHQKNEPIKITNPKLVEPLPRTWFFQTREKARGILQLTAINKNPRGLKLRYKTIEGSGGPPSTEQIDRAQRQWKEALPLWQKIAQRTDSELRKRAIAEVHERLGGTSRQRIAVLRALTRVNDVPFDRSSLLQPYPLSRPVKLMVPKREVKRPYDYQYGGVALVETPEEVDQLRVADETKVAYLTQTTLSVDDANRIIKRLRARFPEILREENVSFPLPRELRGAATE